MAVTDPPRPQPVEIDDGVIEEARRRQRRRRTAGVLLALAVAVGVVAEHSGSGGRVHHARRPLTKPGAPHVPPRPAVSPLRTGYLYTRTIGTFPYEVTAGPVTAGRGSPGAPLVHFLVRQSNETWVGFDGTLHERTVTLWARFASSRDRARWRATGRPFPLLDSGQDSVITGDGQFPPQLTVGGQKPGQSLFTLSGLLSLPTSARALGARVDQAMAALNEREYPDVHDTYRPVQTHADDELTMLTDLLESPLPARQRRAVLNAATSIPGVIVSRSFAHRHGQIETVSIPGESGDPSNPHLVFNPRAAKLLGDAQGTVVAQGAVSTITALPKGIAAIPGPEQTQLISIYPRHGGPRTVFRVQLSYPPGTPAPAHAPQVSASLYGPTGRGCLPSRGRVRLTLARVHRQAGKPSYLYRLNPPTARQTWCAADYELQVYRKAAAFNGSTGSIGYFTSK